MNFVAKRENLIFYFAIILTANLKVLSAI